MRRFATRCKIAAVAIAALIAGTANLGDAAADRDANVTRPPAFTVSVFANAARARSLDWMRVAVPFMLAERLEAHRDLRPAYGELVVPFGKPPEMLDAVAVADLARAQNAELVFTGSIGRAANWDLVLTVELWRSDQPGTASLIASGTRRGDFKLVHRFTGELIEELMAAAKIPVRPADLEEVRRVPTSDYYAFTLFGRGLSLVHGLGRGPDSRRAEQARKVLARALFIDPKLAEAHRVMAELHLGRSRFDRAVGQYSYALELRPGYYAAMAGLARLMYRRGELRESESLHSRMLRRRPWDTSLRYSFGKLLWEKGDVDRSFEELKQVVREQPEHVEARRTLVLIHASRGDSDDLVRELEAVARLDPAHLETRLDLGAAYAAVGAADKAIDVYRGIADDYPGRVQPLKFLGDAYRRRGDIRNAIFYYRKALQVDGNDPRPYFLLGRAYVEAGDDRRAKVIYRRALRFKQYLPETYNNLGAIIAREGKPLRALWYLKRAVAKRPDEADFRYNFALALSALEEIDAAAEQVEIGLSLAPRDARLHYLRGVVRLRVGDVEGARASFDRALELDPKHDDAGHNLALLDKMRRRANDGEIIRERPH